MPWHGFKLVLPLCYLTSRGNKTLGRVGCPCLAIYRKGVVNSQLDLAFLRPRFPWEIRGFVSTAPFSQFASDDPILLNWLNRFLGGGFKYFLCSPRSRGKWSNLTSIFFRWVVQPPTSSPFWVDFDGSWEMVWKTPPESAQRSKGPDPSFTNSPTNLNKYVRSGLNFLCWGWSSHL